jgi:nucleolar protein TMA23
MDAAALLKSQGWRGKGFSLHPTDNTIGLTKPILLSRNTDGRGVGQKQHYTSDQWWLHAFDEKLKGLDTSKKGTVVQSVKQGKLDVVASSQPTGKYRGASGLYASFVRGGMLEGTLQAPGEPSTAGTTPSSSEDSETSVSRKEKRTESKAEKQARRAARRLRKAEKAARKAAEAEAARKAADKAAKKALKQSRKAGETKEERRARRAERRARKEAKRKRREEEKLKLPDSG